MAGRLRNRTPSVSGQQSHALVLGGLGFIGANLSIKLASLGWSVTVCDPVEVTSRGVPERIAALNHQAEILNVGMENWDVVGKAVQSSTVIFDLAGSTGHLLSMQEPLEDLHSNLLVHVEFLQRLRESGVDVPVVAASTRQVLGRSASGVITDGDCPAPVDVNGISKHALESFLRVCGSVWGLQSVILRLPNVYGPHMRVVDSENGVIGGWVGKALKGEGLSVLGDPEVMRNALFVDDAVDAMIACVSLANELATTYLVGGEEITLGGMAETVRRVTSVPIQYQEMPARLNAISPGSVVVDDSGFRRAAGWSPRHSFVEGIGKSFAFFRANEHLCVQ